MSLLHALGDERVRFETSQAHQAAWQAALGDQVICLQNAPTLGVANGTRGELIDISRDGLTVRSPAGDRRLPSTYADDGNLAHGYAITGHKSQGQTVTRAFMLAPDRGDLREWAYVAASRARDETRIYLAESSLDHEHKPPAVLAQTGDTLERFTAAATRAANERLATSPTRESVTQLIARRETLQRDLAQTRRAEREAARALDTLGPIRRRTRGPQLSLTLKDAHGRATALGAEITGLDRTLGALQLEIGERVLAPARDASARSLARP